MESSSHNQSGFARDPWGAIKVHRRASPEFWQRLDVNPFRELKVSNESNLIPGLPLSVSLDRILSARRRSGPDTALIGGPTEPYPVEEKQHRITRIILEVLAKHSYPVLLITGSALVLRDIDLLREINEISSTTVAMSIPTLSSSALKRVQPRSLKLTERLSALERICRSGVQTGMVVWPHLPGVNDSPKSIKSMFKTAHEIGLDFLLVPFADGSFYRRWQQTAEKPVASRLKLTRSLVESSLESRIRLRPKRYIPKDNRGENYWVAGRLADEAYRLRLLGRPFRAHLTAACTINSLKRDIRTLLKCGGMSALPSLPLPSVPDVERLLQGVWADEFDVRA